MAQKILVYQQPIAVIGVSKKSFGYYYFNSQEKQGEDFLNNMQEQRQSRLRAVIIPGSTEWICRLIAMDTVAENYRELLEPLAITINYAEYRQQQIRFNFFGYYLGEFLTRENLRNAQQTMTHREQWQVGLPLHAALKLLSIPSKPQRQRLGRLLRKVLKRVRPSAETTWQPTPYTTILDVCQYVEPHLD